MTNSISIKNLFIHQTRTCVHVGISRLKDIQLSIIWPFALNIQHTSLLEKSLKRLYNMSRHAMETNIIL